MSDRDPEQAERPDDGGPERRERRGHPVVWGLVALVASAAVVGGVLAGGAFLASTALGFAEGGTGESGATAEETLELPPITETARPTEPYGTVSSIPAPDLPSYTGTPESASGITLDAVQDSIAAGQQLDFTGSYPDGVGATLQVQRYEEGVWNDFPVDIYVDGVDFSTYVVTSRTGETRWRVLDVATDEVSNEVTVQIG